MNRRTLNNRGFKDTSLIVGYVSVIIVVLVIFYFFNNDNLNYTPIEHGVILSDSKYYSESNIPGWHRIAARTFFIETPKEYKFIVFEGIDSYVGGFTNKEETIFFDYGLYSNSLTDLSPSDYGFQNELINYKNFRIVIRQNEVQHIAAYTNELDKGNSFMIECFDCQDIEEKHKIIQTIEFKKK